MTEDKAASVENSTEDKKEMPPAYDEANPLTTEEPSVKITSNETKIDIGNGKEREAFQGLTKEELMKYANDPFWVRLRWVLFILFWFIWIAMLVASIVIIIYAPKCPSPEPKQWWQKNVLYEVDLKHDFGTVKNLKDNLDNLVESGVGTIYLPGFFTEGQGTRPDPKTVNSDWGSMEDWAALVTGCAERDQKVVIDWPLAMKNNKDVLEFWMDNGVSGFQLTKEYEHEADIKHLRMIVDARTEETGVPFILLLTDATTNLHGNIADNGVGDLIQLPVYDNNKINPDSATALKENLDTFIESLPRNAWPSFGWRDQSWAESLTDASTMLKMLLPGTPVFNSGQEFGGQKEWSQQEFDKQKSAPESHWQVFSTLASKMRHQDSILFGPLDSTTTFVKGNVFGMTRVKKGNPGYLLTINFAEEDVNVDVSDVHLVPDGIRLMAKSVPYPDDTAPEGEDVTRFESKNVLVKKQEARVFTFVPKYD